MLEEVDAEEEINRDRTTFKMLAFLAFFYLSASCAKKSKKVLISNEMRNKKELSPEYIEKIAEKQAILLRLFEESLLINFKTLWNRVRIIFKINIYFPQLLPLPNFKTYHLLCLININLNSFLHLFIDFAKRDIDT